MYIYNRFSPKILVAGSVSKEINAESSMLMKIGIGYTIRKNFESYFIYNGCYCLTLDYKLMKYINFLL